MDGQKESKKERDERRKKARDEYRIELQKLRRETKTFIPFGANLDLYRKKDVLGSDREQ